MSFSACVYNISPEYICLEVELLSHMVWLCTASEENYQPVFQSCWDLYIPRSTVCKFLLLHIFTNTCYCHVFFNIRYSGVIKFHYRLTFNSSITNDVNHIFIFIVYFSPWSVDEVFCYIFNGVGCLAIFFVNVLYTLFHSPNSILMKLILNFNDTQSMFSFVFGYLILL